MSEENVESVLRAVAAFNQRDAAAFSALLTPDAEVVPFRAAMEGTSYRGHDGALQFFSDTDEAWAAVTVEPGEFDDRGDLILAFGCLRGQGRGSGAQVEAELAWVIRFRDGLITSLRTYTDHQEAREDATSRNPDKRTE